MALTEIYGSSLQSDGSGDGTIGNPYSIADGQAAVTSVGTRLNLKADGTYDISSLGFALGGSGSTTSPVIIRGYKTTVGDTSIGGSLYSRTNGNGPRVTTNMVRLNLGTLVQAIGAHDCILEGLYITGTCAGALMNPTGINILFVSCVFENASTNASATGITVGAADFNLVDCDVTLTGASGGSAGVACGATLCNLTANRIKGGPAPGITISTGAQRIVHNTIYRSAGAASINVTGTTGNPYIGFNTIVNQGGTGDGIKFAAAQTKLQCVIGNLITDNAAYGLDFASAVASVVSAFNRFRGNGTNPSTGATDWLAATSYGNVTTGSTTDYVAPASDDYRLLASSPAAATGIPGGNNIGSGPAQSSGGGSSKLGLSI